MVKRVNKKLSFIISRVGFLGMVITMGFMLVVGNLIKIQFVEGEKWSKKAYNQQVNNQILSPNRGTIYDAKGKILAQSISVDTISINPGKITNVNNKAVPNQDVAQAMVDIFGVQYDEMLKELESKKSVVVVAKKVEKEKVDRLKTWMKENDITAGINIDEDSKRYYPFNNLASNLIGFCGTDNEGQTGIEERWNRVLTGTAGKIVTYSDGKNQAISDADEQYIASENGSNIYLTIDTAIQGIAEKYLKKALVENPTAESGTALIMNPKTGDILAMVSAPDYNLNDPFNYQPTGFTEEQWKALPAVERTNSLLELWKNDVVTGTYEPGSTFKLITAAIGLEEGFVKTDTPNDFHCEGKYVVAVENNEPIPIQCWKTVGHGTLSLRGALENSCNPAFMQLGQRIGAKTLYKYYNAFNLFEPVGNDIAKAYKGAFTPLDKVGPVELATASFGQRFEISPLQLVSAVSAICNDGYLVEPKIVKQIENTDTGSIEKIETKTIRQVISKDTSDKIKNMMLSVVQEGTGRNAKIQGYTIGGKSGTSEPRPNKKEDGYVASFIAVSPIENIQVIALVALYGCDESAPHQGGGVAAPVVADMLKEVLPTLGITSSGTSDDKNNNVQNQANNESLKSLPSLKDLTVAEAINKLEAMGFVPISSTKADLNAILVTNQLPKPGVVLTEGSSVVLYTDQDEPLEKVSVPNLKDMTAEQAINILKAKNLNVNVTGNTGVVLSQDPTFDTMVEKGTVVNIVIKEKITDVQ